MIDTKRKPNDTLNVGTVEHFIQWASVSLRSPRSVWLFSVAISHGSVFVALRAAIRNNNVPVAKGCMYLLKSLAWCENLPIYRQCILRSGLTEEVQVKNFKN